MMRRLGQSSFEGWALSRKALGPALGTVHGARLAITLKVQGAMGIPGFGPCTCMPSA
jgi:hypothetical protein